MEERITSLRKKFRSLGVTNYLVTRPSNVRYLCGFTGSSGVLLVTSSDAHFITDGRYTNQASEQVAGANVHTYKNGSSPANAFVREMKTNKEIRFRGRLGIESSFMTVEFYQHLHRIFPKISLIETTDVNEELAIIKNDTEIDAIRRAVEISDKVFESILADIKPGKSEMEISAEITYRHKKFGASKDSFEAIVASGHRSAMPHGIASTKIIEDGDLVTLDFGCVVDGYPSDMTRTVVVGKASERQKEIYGIIQEAQLKAVEAIRPGVKCNEVDAVARDIITKAGYAKNFTHGLGHGLGLEVHALPRLSSVSRTVLKPGMVVTVEPGIYFDGFGGVRIEDDVVVTDDGYEVLNRSPRNLIEL